MASLLWWRLCAFGDRLTKCMESFMHRKMSATVFFCSIASIGSQTVCNKPASRSEQVDKEKAILLGFGQR